MSWISIVFSQQEVFFDSFFLQFMYAVLMQSLSAVQVLASFVRALRSNVYWFWSISLRKRQICISNYVYLRFLKLISQVRDGHNVTLTKLSNRSTQQQLNQQLNRIRKFLLTAGVHTGGNSPNLWWSATVPNSTDSTMILIGANWIHPKTKMDWTMDWQKRWWVSIRTIYSNTQKKKEL